MKKSMRSVAASVLLSCLCCAIGVAQESRNEALQPTEEKDEPLALLLKRVGESVERYQGELLNIAFIETMREQELKRDLTTPDGKPKEYVFDNIVLRQPVAAEGRGSFAKASRRLRAVNGKPVALGKPYVEKGKCGENGPRDSYADPLSFLLPEMQPRFEFTDKGRDTLEGRASRVIGFTPRGQDGPKVEHKGDCFWASIPYEGRVWIDAASGDVTQLEWRIKESFEFESPRAFNVGSLRFGPKRRLNYARSEFVTRFRRVQFKDPEQTLLLPASSESLRVIEGASRPRVRVTRAFTDYRRFVSDVKVIEDAEPNN